MNPEVNDYVVVKITQVMQYGAYAELEEFPGWKGFIHISEVAPHWVKNIRSHVKEGQIRVAKVLRVYPDKKSVDLSLKRVSNAMAKRKMEAVRRAKRGKHLMELAAKISGRDPSEIIPLIEEEYGDLFEVFEQAALHGEKALEKIPEEWRAAILSVANKYIEVPRKKVMGEVEAVVPGPRGAQLLRKAFEEAKELVKGVEVSVYTSGAPKYIVELVAHDYKVAEGELKKYCDKVVERIEKYGGRALWRRLKA